MWRACTYGAQRGALSLPRKPHRVVVPVANKWRISLTPRAGCLLGGPVYVAGLVGEVGSDGKENVIRNVSGTISGVFSGILGLAHYPPGSQ